MRGKSRNATGFRSESVFSCGDAVLYLADYRDVLSSLESVDAIVTDPPYGGTSLSWDRVDGDWPKLVRPNLARHASLWVFGSFRYFLDEAGSFDQAGFRCAQEVIWEKHNGSNFNADRFKRVHEIAAQFYPKNRRWSEIVKVPQVTHDAKARSVFRKAQPHHTGKVSPGYYETEDGGPRMMRSVIRARSCHGHAEHPTQKPIAIIDPVLRFSTNAGSVVFDPFMGSGSVGVSAIQSGRKFVGVEINPKYFDIAVRRISECVSKVCVA